MENKHCAGCGYYFYILEGCDFEKFNNGKCPCSICLVKMMCKKFFECQIRQKYFDEMIAKHVVGV